MKRIFKRKKGFTLVEFIIVIIVIGLLCGLASMKIIGMKKDAQVTTLYKDVDALEKVSMKFNVDNNDYPIKGNLIDKKVLSKDLRDLMMNLNDNGNKLYEIDLDKCNPNITPLKQGYKKNGSDDYYIISEETNNVYYVKGLIDSKSMMHYGQDAKIVLKDVKLGTTDLVVNTSTDATSSNDTITGLIKSNCSLKANLNGADISNTVTYTNISFSNSNSKNNLIVKDVYAADSYKQFSIHVNLNSGDNNLSLIIPEENMKKNYTIVGQQKTYTIQSGPLKVYYDGGIPHDVFSFDIPEGATNVQVQFVPLGAFYSVLKLNDVIMYKYWLGPLSYTNPSMKYDPNLSTISGLTPGHYVLNQALSTGNEVRSAMYSGFTITYIK